MMNFFLSAIVAAIMLYFFGAFVVWDVTWMFQLETLDVFDRALIMFAYIFLWVIVKE